jgi:hypothetical protein
MLGGHSVKIGREFRLSKVKQADKLSASRAGEFCVVTAAPLR